MKPNLSLEIKEGFPKDSRIVMMQAGKSSMQGEQPVQRPRERTEFVPFEERNRGQCGWRYLMELGVARGWARARSGGRREDVAFFNYGKIHTT